MSRDHLRNPARRHHLIMMCTVIQSHSDISWISCLFQVRDPFTSLHLHKETGFQVWETIKSFPRGASGYWGPSACNHQSWYTTFKWWPHIVLTRVICTWTVGGRLHILFCLSMAWIYPMRCDAMRWLAHRFRTLFPESCKWARSLLEVSRKLTRHSHLNGPILWFVGAGNFLTYI